MLKFVIVIILGLCLGYFASAEDLGSRNKPLQLAIVPSGNATRALDNAKPFAACIEKRAGLTVNITIPNSYIAVVEAIGSGKTDVAFGNITAYLLANEKYGAEALLQVQRYGNIGYNSFILVKDNSPIKEFKDLNGKKFGYPDGSSASGFIMPSMEMRKQKLKFSQELFTGSMEAAVIAVLQGKVDAAGGFFDGLDTKGNRRDSRSKLKATHPNIETETRVIWTSESIPNEPVIVRKNLSHELKVRLTNVLIQCTIDNPRAIGNIDALVSVSPVHNAYNIFKASVQEAGLDIFKLVNKQN